MGEIIKTAYTSERIDFERYNKFINSADQILYNLNKNTYPINEDSKKYEDLKKLTALMTTLFDMFIYRMSKDMRKDIKEKIEKIEKLFNNKNINVSTGKIFNLDKKVIIEVKEYYRLIHWEIQKITNPMKKEGDGLDRG